MSPTQSFIALQWTQFQHDEAFHADIANLPKAQRLQHINTHFCKYYLQLDAPNITPERTNALLVDIFIMALSGANVMNLALPTSGTPQDLSTPQSLKYALLPAFLTFTKSLEGLDHLEPINYAATLTQSLTTIAEVCTTAAAQRHLPLIEATQARWQSIENKNPIAAIITAQRQMHRQPYS